MGKKDLQNRSTAAKSSTKGSSSSPPSSSSNTEIIVNDHNLVDCDEDELRSLLDDAFHYRGPRDKVGKSSKFLNMIEQAEDAERSSRAYQYGGPKSVRHCNQSKLGKPRNGKKENSGSLEDLSSKRTNQSARDNVQVSEKQQKGGSLPCGVNTMILSKQIADRLDQKVDSGLDNHNHVKTGVADDKPVNVPTVTLTEDYLKKQKHPNRRERRNETEIQIDYYPTDNITLLLQHINSTTTTSTATANQNKAKKSKLKKCSSYDDLRNTKKHSIAPTGPTSTKKNTQKPKLKKSNSLENLNNKKKSTAAAAKPKTQPLPPDIPTLLDTVLVLTPVDKDDVEVQDNFDDFHEVKKRRKKPRKDTTPTITTTPIESNKHSTNEKTISIAKTTPATPKFSNTSSNTLPPRIAPLPVPSVNSLTKPVGNCDKVVQSNSSIFDEDKKSSYAEIIKGSSSGSIGGNRSFPALPPSINGTDSHNNLSKNSRSKSADVNAKKTVTATTTTASRTPCVNIEKKSTYLTVNGKKIKLSRECIDEQSLRLHEPLIEYLSNAWFETLNRNHPPVYYAENMDINI